MSVQTSDTKSGILGAVITVLAGVLIIIGAFLPWLSAQAAFLSISRNAFQLGNQNGLSPDGVILLVMGIVAILIGAACAMRATLDSYVLLFPIILGACGVIVALNRVGSINDRVHQVRAASSLASASIGYGLWITVVAGVLAVVGALAMRPGASAAKAAPTGEGETS